MLLPTSLLALWLTTASSPVLAATAGSFVESGNTLVSAMMVNIFINSAGNLSEAWTDVPW